MPRSLFLALVALAIATCARPAAAQAWAPRAGQGEVTFVTQMIDHVGRVFGDVRVDCCGTTNVAVDVDVDYGVSDRWSASISLPYVFAKYRGGPPDGPAAFLPYPAVDSCRCVHSSLQDVAVASHYNLLRVRRSFSLMTSASIGSPTHNYEYAGEAVVGFGLKELHLSVDAGLRKFIVPGLSVNGQYAYSIVERVLDIGHNRSNAQFEASYAGTSRLSGRAILSIQRTHGGLQFPQEVEPFPERYSEFHRLLQDNYLQAGAGVSYVLGNWDVSLSYLRTLSGTNTHDLRVYTVTAGRPFRIRR